MRFTLNRKRQTGKVCRFLFSFLASLKILTLIDDWQDHYRRYMIESRCKDPKPQVFPSSSDPTRLYMPRCTILHRCSDDTACCPSVDKTCVANTKERIELAFMVSLSLKIIAHLNKKTNNCKGFPSTTC